MGKHNRRKKNQLKQGNITPLKQAKTLNVLSSPPNINTNTRILYIIIVIIKKKSANRQVTGVIRTVLSIFASFVSRPITGRKPSSPIRHHSQIGRIKCRFWGKLSNLFIMFELPLKRKQKIWQLCFSSAICQIGTRR